MTAFAPPPPAGRLSGRGVLAILAAFFATVAGADALLATAAFRTWSGLEEPSPYQASQRYNAELARARTQSARGWRLDAALAREGGTGAAVSLDLRDAASAPLSGLSLRARLERPTDKRADRAVPVAEVAPGRYAGHLPAVTPGQWVLVVEVVEADGLAFRRRQRFVLD